MHSDRAVCAACGHANRDTARFCAACGAAMARACSGCGGTLPEGARFCDSCGLAVPGLVAAPPLPAEPPAAQPAERRQVTVLFCDLVESMALSARLDPEDYRELVAAYQGVCAAVVDGLEGHVAQYLGDGLLVYFGYPQAHEGDAQRAVLAALRIVLAVEGLNPRLQQRYGVALALRAGIHTGLVVAGEVGAGARRELLAMGDVPNVAARLQHVAAINTVAVSAATHKLAQGWFAWEDLGLQTLKGVAGALQVYRPVAQSAARTRLEASAPQAFSPLVGRETELALLRARWSQACAGQGQWVLVQGEPGIGKSRLVAALRDEVAGDARAWMTPLQCSPFHRHSAFYPVVELLDRVVLRFGPADTPERKLRALEGWLAQFGLPLAEVLPLFAQLLNIPPDTRYPASTLLPEEQRQRILQAMHAIMLHVARRQPLLFIVEDLHWADASTLQMLAGLVELIPSARMLALLTARPEFVPPWGRRGNALQVTLPRLDARQIGQLASGQAGLPLPAEVLEQIVERTDGVPLFVEELTKMLLESSLLAVRGERYELAAPLPAQAIPATLQDSLLARLDHLAAGRAQAQFAACIGRRFSYALLCRAAPWDEATLRAGLARLVEAELLYRAGTPADPAYAFKHALVQDTALASLLRSTRQSYHARIAAALMESFSDLAQAQPEVVAHHYAEAGMAAQAIEWWSRAASRALERYANAEAVAHARQALAALVQMPEAEERVRQELALQSVVSIGLLTTLGYSAPETGAAYERAHELACRLAEPGDTSAISYGRWAHAFVAGDLLRARALGQELGARLPAEHPVQLVVHRMIGFPELILGDPGAARDHAEAVRAVYEPARHHALATLYGQDPGAAACAFGALAWSQLGYPETALARLDEALQRIRERPHPHTCMQVLGLGAMLSQYLRDASAVLCLCGEGELLARRYGNPFWLGIMHSLQAWAHAAMGALELAQALASQGGEELLRSRTGIFPQYFALQRGELLAAAGRPREAERDMMAAVAIAQGQGARSPELRGALALARLWQQQGRGDAGRALLAPLYASFAEGRDQADVRAAREFLQAG